MELKNGTQVSGTITAALQLQQAWPSVVVASCCPNPVELCGCLGHLYRQLGAGKRWEKPFAFVISAFVQVDSSMNTHLKQARAQGAELSP